MFVDVEKMEVRRGGRNGNYKDIRVRREGSGRHWGDHPPFLFKDSSCQTFGFLRIVRKKPKIVFWEPFTRGGRIKKMCLLEKNKIRFVFFNQRKKIGKFLSPN